MNRFRTWLRRSPVRWPASIVIAALIPVGMLGRTALDAHADERPDSAQAAVGQSSPWPMEQVRLHNGRTYRGLIERESPLSLDIVEIYRPPGKPMFGVVRRIATTDVRRVEHLGQPQRARLLERVDQFRHRARIEALGMEQVVLRPDQQNGGRLWHYEDRNEEGRYFTLASDLDEATTRRVVVRLDQMFRAYRRLIPPRIGQGNVARRPLRIRLFGSMERYREFLSHSRLSIEHPAFYSVADNRIVVGGSLDAFARELATNRRHQERLLLQFEEKAGKELEDLGRLLRQAKLSRDRRAQVLRAARGRNDAALAKIQAQIAAVQRRSEARFAELTSEMFARLYHEAFHAYLENYVYPHQRFTVPRWLNEGLAQVFEQGRLESDTLRLDAPDARSLTRFQADLRREPLPLRDLLTADEDVFLVTHSRKSSDASRRHYLYSWALTYYLTMERPLLSADALDRYVAQGVPERSRQERFEQLVGGPLDKFETEFHATMLALVPISTK